MSGGSQVEIASSQTRRIDEGHTTRRGKSPEKKAAMQMAWSKTGRELELLARRAVGHW